jgi:hypothetical protein
MEYHNSRQYIKILFWKYLFEIKSEVWLNIFLEIHTSKWKIVCGVTCSKILLTTARESPGTCEQEIREIIIILLSNRACHIVSHTLFLHSSRWIAYRGLVRHENLRFLAVPSSVGPNTRILSHS